MLCDSKPRQSPDSPYAPLYQNHPPETNPSAPPRDPDPKSRHPPGATRFSHGKRAGRRADVQRGCRGSEGPRPCWPPFLPPPWPGTPGIWAAGARPPPALCSHWPVAPGPGPPLRSPSSPASPACSNPPLSSLYFLGVGGGVEAWEGSGFVCGVGQGLWAPSFQMQEVCS